MRCAIVVFASALMSACGAVADSVGGKEEGALAVQETATKAVCGPGSQPETDLQGRVPLEERQSGRSELGYWCNLELVGQYQGTGASWQHAWYDDCAYYDTAFPGAAGVQVIDASNPAEPTRARSLLTPSMLDPWESLKVNEKRGLLAAVAAWNLAGPVFFDVYDVSTDCANPTLRASVPMNVVGHEGEWAPDGLTYYGTLFATTAIDVSNPALPRRVATIDTSTHGLNVSDDGTRAYFANIGGDGNGLQIRDVSQIQSRALNPQAPIISELFWTDGATAQHTIPVTIQGKPYVIFVDEGGKGAARIIDISDEKNPFIVSKLKLEIHLPENDTAFQADTADAGGFQYEAHYCGVDQRTEPTVLGCGYFQSGMRVFDIRDPYHPKEIAYFNPPAQRTKSLRGSNRFFPTYSGDATSGYSSSQVRFIKDRGEVWFTDQDSGFMVVRFTNGVWPFKD